jgi:hypothetical protein
MKMTSSHSHPCPCGQRLGHSSLASRASNSHTGPVHIWSHCCCGGNAGGNGLCCTACRRCLVFFEDDISTICGIVDCPNHTRHDDIPVILNCRDCNNNTTFSDPDSDPDSELGCYFCFCHRCHEELTSLVCSRCDRCAFFNNETGACNEESDNGNCRFHPVCAIGPNYEYTCWCETCETHLFCGRCDQSYPKDDVGNCMGCGREHIRDQTCIECGNKYNVEDYYCPYC